MFETEHELMAAFDAAVKCSDLWLGSPGHRTFMMEEVEGIHGRVDRMMVSLPSGARPEKARSELLQHETCCRIVVALRAKQPKPLDQLAVEVGRSPATVRYWASRMEQEGIVRRIIQHGYVLGPKANLPDCEIWCFEGKLRDWKRALYQATRYRAFAHRSFVVMPENAVWPAESQVHQFRLARVGLLALDSAGWIQMITSPRPQQPRSLIMHTMAKGRVLAHIA